VIQWVFSYYFWFRNIDIGMYSAIVESTRGWCINIKVLVIWTSHKEPIDRVCLMPIHICFFTVARRLKTNMASVNHPTNIRKSYKCVKFWFLCEAFVHKYHYRQQIWNLAPISSYHLAILWFHPYARIVHRWHDALFCTRYAYRTRVYHASRDRMSWPQ